MEGYACAHKQKVEETHARGQSYRNTLANTSVSLSHSSEPSQHFIHSKWVLKISNSALWEVEQGYHSMEMLGKYTETCLLVRWQSLIYYYTSLSHSLSLSISLSLSLS